jgi:hypothetical protein
LRVASATVEVIWQGEVVGFIDEPNLDMFHLSGEWRRGEGQATDLFLREVAQALERWDTDLAGVDVLIGATWRHSGEVTRLQDGSIEVLLRPPSG